jgi:hypothetical protein
MNLYHFEWDTDSKYGRALIIAKSELHAISRLYRENPTTQDHDVQLIKVISLSTDDTTLVYHHEIVND